MTATIKRSLYIPHCHTFDELSITGDCIELEYGVTGKAESRKHLTNSRDAIRCVYDQTIRMMNTGVRWRLRTA